MKKILLYGIAVVSVAVAAFSIFGFLAAGEPGYWVMQIIYPIICVAVIGAGATAAYFARK